MRLVLILLVLSIPAFAQDAPVPMPASSPAKTVRTEHYDGRGRLVRVEERPADDGRRVIAVRRGLFGFIREVIYEDGTRVNYAPLGGAVTTIRRPVK